MLRPAAGFILATVLLLVAGIGANAAPQENHAARAIGAVVQLTEYTALKTHNQGPQSARGVIYFIDGLDASLRMSDSFKATYPYLSELNSRYGWDIINAKYPNAQKDVATSIARSSGYVHERIKNLRAQGYRRVVLAGQSWGAWLSIEIAKRDASEKLVDAMMLMAPAAYGPKVWNGAYNPHYLQNLTEYVRSIKAVRTPTVAVFFEGDEFDPGERGEVTEAFFLRNKVPLLLIDRPAGFSGHGAGWLPTFADLYGDCIGNFLQSPRTASCDSANSPVAAAKSLDEAEVAHARGSRLLKPEELAGRSFILTSPSLQVQTLGFGANKVEIATTDEMFDAELAQSGRETCIGKRCFRVYRQASGRYLTFEDTGKFVGWMEKID